ncbi:MAG TPA: GIY-YIG nuclease family protein [Pseudonocardiaceae bacterium]|nr:GIY-YIG nuclease family protein [Pseudonocardiaceae bacterium]
MPEPQTSPPNADDNLVMVEVYGLRAVVKRAEYERWAWGLDVSAIRQDLMADQCAIAVADRRCSRGATEDFGVLRLCWQHHEKLIAGFRQALRKDDALLAAARQVIADKDATGRSRQQTERDVRLKQDSVVYFVERDGFVKIGYSSDLVKRLAAIGRGNSMPAGMSVGPVRLLATMPGARPKEGYLHRNFDYLRLGGSEWFLLDNDLWTFITGLKGYTGEPRITAESLVGAR